MLSYSEEETKKFGKDIGKKLKAGSIVALYGEMGTGKTILTKGIVEYFCPHIVVKSPSFIYVNKYECKIPIYHIDLYRINHLSDALFLGVDELLNSGAICIIEWPEKIKELLPQKRIEIEIKIVDENIREINYKEL